MASPQASQHIRSTLVIQLWDHDPDTASAIVTTPDGGTTDRYMDGRDLTHFAAMAVPSLLIGAGVTKLEIIAASDAAGTDLTVIKTSGTIAADSLGDWAIQECSMEEVAQEGADAGVALRYVAARITVANAGDECKVVYIGIPKRAYLNRTPATTIS